MLHSSSSIKLGNKAASVDGLKRRDSLAFAGGMKDSEKPYGQSPFQTGDSMEESGSGYKST